ncbi:hypothetical protein JJC03_04205 [Flavobacterium oreochromis]|uniref:hypothetical protein n=1 Tax=Flavobacterium oreochromis TaxID=2906078 RepID=UPI001CE64D06|nr:hypothetical protein [Flavobacterium oreochromis]QYS87160.1 hypothetical protein JJC03_04205 [Flavobacterium oreochromis]
MLFTIILVSCGSNRSISQINQKRDQSKGNEIVLQKVLNDSRCPQGVQCIWEGEVTIQVAYFEKGQMKEEKQFTLRQNDQEEVLQWFRSHLPKSQKVLQTVSILPTKVEGKKLTHWSMLSY